MAPSRRRGIPTNNNAVTPPKKSRPDLSSSESDTEDSSFQSDSSSSPINEINRMQLTPSTRSQMIKLEPQEINIKCDPEQEGNSYTPSGENSFLKPFKEEKSEQEDEEQANVTTGTEGKKSTCFCGKSYSCNSHLNRHQKKVHGMVVRPATSSQTVCKKENVEKNGEEKSEERRFSCQCGKSYTNNSNLKRHRKLCGTDETEESQEESVSSPPKEGELIKPYICICGKSYTCSSHLYRHQKTHQEFQTPPNRRYVCDCGKSYSCSSHLHRHQKIHAPPKPPSVEQTKIKVEEPESTEQKVKPYLCFCGKSYTCSSHLYRHQKSHPELNAVVREKCVIRDVPPEKRFQCKCGKSYSCRSHLKRHQKSHQEQVIIAQDSDSDRHGEVAVEEVRQQPFVCECGKKFILSFSLLLHKKIHCRWKQPGSESGPPGL